MQPISIMVPARVLVIMAHPDDLEDFCGGTLATWNAGGSDITALLLTSGDKGCKDPSLTPEQVTILREREHLAAARVLGIRHSLFLREPDGELFTSLALRKRVLAEVRRCKPDIVVAPDPTRYYFGDYYINHADHRAAGEIALAAVSPAANNARFSPELLAQGLLPHQVRAIWLTTPTEPNHQVDISACIECKINAFLCHDSQISDPTEVRQRMLRESEYTPEGKAPSYRELFRVMRLA